MNYFGRISNTIDHNDEDEEEEYEDGMRDDDGEIEGEGE